jgi:hypothetical protein
MAFALTDTRSDIDNLLATAVDSSTWTTAIKDEAARQALRQYDDLPVYEASFTVSSAGEAQDLSSLTDLKQVLSLAWPWSDGAHFDSLLVRWRYTTDQTVYIEDGEPAVGDLIRVRYKKLHRLNNLDSAVSTTVPDRHRLLLALLAAAWACELRIRQLTENPAIPTEAIRHLGDLAQRLRIEAQERSRSVQTLPGAGISWSTIGL